MWGLKGYTFNGHVFLMLLDEVFIFSVSFTDPMKIMEKALKTVYDIHRQALLGKCIDCYVFYENIQATMSENRQ